VGSDGLIQSAAVNAARFDHTSAGVCRGLLIEESRTNLFQRSDDFNNAYWTKTGSSISSDSTTSPSGSVDADKIVEDTSTGAHGVSVNPTITSGIAYTLSFYAKKGERSWIRATLATTAISTWFDLDNGVLGTVGVGVTASIQSVGAGWYRCVVTTTSASTSGNVNIRSQTVDGQTIYTGDGTSGVFIWGAQLEAGSFATSYIPTVASSVVRSADVCSITGANFSGMWNQSEGTLLSWTQKTSTNANAFVISASDGGFNNETDLRYNSVSQTAALINVSGASQITGFQANITSGSEVKQSIAYKLNDCAYAANGASPILDTSALIPTVNRLTIGNVAVAGSTFYLNGTIASIRYFRKRLPNAKLQSLTA
jgi:hypothetical protein